MGNNDITGLLNEAVHHFSMLFPGELNRSFRTFVLIVYLVEGAELFTERPSYTVIALQDNRTQPGVGCDPCDIWHEMFQEQHPSQPPTIVARTSSLTV